MITSEGRGTTFKGKIIDYIGDVSSPLTPHKRYCRIDLTYNLTNTDCSTYKLQPKYDNYLCFTITYRTNKLVHYQNDKYSDDQKHTYELIKSLHDEGWGYRRITKHLNNKRILTHTGKTWVETGNSVYSVLKK